MARFLKEQDVAAVFDGIEAGVFLVDPATHRVTYANPRALERMGRTLAEVAGAECHGLVCPAERGKCPITDLGQDVDRSERSLVTRGGGGVLIRKTVSRIRVEGGERLVESFVDISDLRDAESGRVRERQQSEDALRESEERFRALAEQSLVAIVLIRNGLVAYANEAAIELGSYPVEETLAWGQDGLFNLVHPDDRPALTSFYESLKAGASTTFGQDLRIVRRSGEVRWVTIAGRRLDLAGEPTFAFSLLDVTERHGAEERLEDGLRRLRKAFNGTIEAITRAIETRDPYTAGHQRRVADLARSIGTVMGLSPDQIDAIRLAGAIHDIGKIAVPAEILARPGKLSAPEFSLIQAHPQVGADMLEPVQFPWPLHEIILQHHERLDGSGYPNGAKGEAIRVEARIIAVADVVEAMASHRPYRPALGIDAALGEILAQRGTKLDTEAVDACTRLFRERGYQFPR